MKNNIRKRKKYMFSFGILLVMMGVLTACAKNGTKDEKEKKSDKKTITYTYENEEVCDIKIKKTKVYPKKLEITFKAGSISEVEEVVCYGTDFSVIEEQPEFSFEGNVLTIETKNADKISGLHVVENYERYFDVRYLDSDSYAMLVYTLATEIGYISEGDKDVYYTQEEKDEQKEKERALAEEQANIYHKLFGIWENESGTVRIEFYFDEEHFNKTFSVYEFVNDNWVEQETVYVASVDERESFECMRIELYDNPHWGCVYHFDLLDDGSGMECNYSDEKFIRK